MSVIPASKRGIEAVRLIADVISEDHEPTGADMDRALKILNTYVAYVNSDGEYACLLADDDPSVHISGYGE